jgi:Fe-S-cluster containining protein
MGTMERHEGEEKESHMSAKWKRALHPLPVEKEESGQCKCCGTCCAFISIPPFREDEVDRLPPDIQQVIDWYTRHDRDRPRSPVPCYFYDMTTRLCLIHEHKPHTCREFEPGGRACRQQRSDLLGALNNYRDATKQWAKQYTRFVAPGARIQEIAEFRREEDDALEGVLQS